MNKIKATLTFLAALFSVEKVPVKDGKSDFTDDQLALLKDKVGEEDATAIVEAIDKHAKDIAASQEDKEQLEENAKELQTVRDELKSFLSDNNLTEDEAKKIVADDAGADPTLTEMLSSIKKLVKNQDAMIQKLMAEPEIDTPIDSGSLKTPTDLRHSKTHFMATGRELDAFAGRPWNQRAAGISKKPTDWAANKGANIEKLSRDIEDNWTEVSDSIKSLHRDNLKLPAFWPMRSRVDDRVADGNIVSAEITQARKLPWLPKNKQMIQPEEGRVFPVNIDIEFAGYYLQQIEASWLNGWNREGTSPYKMSFVDFLLSELDKKARQEDRIVAIKGVYVPTPEDATVPGQAINRGDGLLIQLFRAYFIEKKFKTPNIGVPSVENIVDYVPKFIEANLKEELKEVSGLVIYMSPTWIRTHKKRYRQIHGVENNYASGDVMMIENYPNIRMEPLVDLEGTDLFLMTFDDNIELLENIPNEKSIYRMDTLKRMIYIYADYKWGIRLKHIGTKVKDTDPDAFKVQTVWTNGAPFFKSDFFVSIYDNGTGEVAIPFSNIKVNDGWNTDITEITGTYPGQVVKVRGNENATKVVKKNTKLLLASDFDLSTGGTLTLYVQEDGKLKELGRTTAPEAGSSSDESTFSGTSIDASDGSKFVYSGGSAQDLAEILNGFDGQEIAIYGNATAALTVSNVSGNIKVASDAVLAKATDTITLVKIDGVFTEVERDITA